LVVDSSSRSKRAGGAIKDGRRLRQVSTSPCDAARRLRYEGVMRGVAHWQCTAEQVMSALRLWLVCPLLLIAHVPTRECDLSFQTVHIAISAWICASSHRVQVMPHERQRC
jgi:hypothetical protein